MKIFIHVGNYKTATSSIQSSLFRSRKKLISNGILYPLTGLRSQEGVLDKYSRAHHTWYKAAVADYGLSSDRKTGKLVSLLAIEIREKKPETVIISSELFSNCSKDHHKEGALRILVRELSELGEVKIIYCFRNPYEWSESMTAQQLTEHPVSQVAIPMIPSFLGDIYIFENIIGVEVKALFMDKDDMASYFEQFLSYIGAPKRIKLDRVNEKKGVKSILMRQVIYSSIDHRLIFHEYQNRFVRRELLRECASLDKYLSRNTNLYILQSAHVSKIKKSMDSDAAIYRSISPYAEKKLFVDSLGQVQCGCTRGLIEDVFFSRREKKLISSLLFKFRNYGAIFSAFDECLVIKKIELLSHIYES